MVAHFECQLIRDVLYKKMATPTRTMPQHGEHNPDVTPSRDHLAFKFPRDRLEDICDDFWGEMGAEEMGAKDHFFQNVSQHFDARPGERTFFSTLTDGLEPDRFGICGSKRPARNWSRKRSAPVWSGRVRSGSSLQTRGWRCVRFPQLPISGRWCVCEVCGYICGGHARTSLVFQRLKERPREKSGAFSGLRRHHSVSKLFLFEKARPFSLRESLSEREGHLPRQSLGGGKSLENRSGLRFPLSTKSRIQGEFLQKLTFCTISFGWTNPFLHCGVVIAKIMKR